MEVELTAAASWFILNQDSEQHFSELSALIENLPKLCRNGDSHAVEKALERYKKLLDLYQEQPQLLKPVVEGYLNKLLSYVLQSTCEDALYDESSKYLCHLTKVFRYKLILRYLPHDVFLLETVLSMLERQIAATATGCRGCFETSYVLLLWLTILCKAPFDLSRFDNTRLATTNGFDGSTNGQRVSVQERLFRVGENFLGAFEGSRNMAAVMLSELVTRPDCQSLLKRCMRQCVDRLRKLEPLLSAKDELMAHGCCALIANCMKKGRREDLLDLAHELFAELSALPNIRWSQQSTLLRKAWVKVVQRIAMVSLRPAVAASWRYRRGVRSLTAMQSDPLATKRSQSLNTDGSHRVGCKFSIVCKHASQEMNGEDETTEFEELDEACCADVEAVIGLLLEYISDSSLSVHWSAAKGIGRITFRLPSCLGNDVVRSLLDMFETYRSPQSENFWRGGCLALAELGRRGLLLPDQLPQVMNIVNRALVYDEYRGNFSVGSIVRDAACYLSWSFARAYDPDDFKPYVTPLARTLICVALFDREISCRRAASAAFQEHVGRQGSFPHGIEIFTKVDFFTAGKCHCCYLEYSIFVAQFAEYTRSLIDHLVSYKVVHWDEQIRVLVAEALGLLTPCDPEYVKDVVLGQLLAISTMKESFSRQGALYALGSTVVALATCLGDRQSELEQQFYHSDTYQRVIALPSQFFEANFFGAMNNDLLRKALNEFVYRLSSRLCPVATEQLQLWLTLICENLYHKSENIRERAAVALKGLCDYSEGSGASDSQLKASIDKSIESWLSDVKQDVSETRRLAGALALESIPKTYIEKQLSLVIDCLTAGTKISRQNVAWVDARKQCLVSLAKVALAAKLPLLIRSGVDVDRLFRCFAQACTEYTIDMRGDVGKVVRDAAVCSFGMLWNEFSTAPEFVSVPASTPASSSPSLVSQATIVACIGGVLQQCCGSMSKLRISACSCMTQIVSQAASSSGRSSSPSLIPDVDQLRKVFVPAIEGQAAASFDWKFESESFPRLVALLDIVPYRRNVLFGFVLSAGNVLVSTAKHAGDCLIEYVQRVKSDESKLLPLFSDLCSLFEAHRRSNRISLSIMHVLDTLFSCDFFTDEYSFKFMPLLDRIYQATVQQTSSGVLLKTLAALPIFCDLMQFDGTELAAKAMSNVIAFLVSDFPPLRRAAATQLYEAVLSYVPLDNHAEQVLQLLSETNWDAPVADLQPIHASVESMLRSCYGFGA